MLAIIFLALLTVGASVADPSVIVVQSSRASNGSEVLSYDIEWDSEVVIFLLGTSSDDGLSTSDLELAITCGNLSYSESAQNGTQLWYTTSSAQNGTLAITLTTKQLQPETTCLVTGEDEAPLFSFRKGKPKPPKPSIPGGDYDMDTWEIFLIVAGSISGFYILVKCCICLFK